MKKLLKWLLRIIATALVLTLVIVAFPYVRALVSSWMGQVNYTEMAQTLSHEMRETGKLTTTEYTDTGVLTSSVDALFLGSVSSISVPYQYDIGLGLDLSRVEVTANDASLTVYLPEIEMIFDKLTVTDTPQIKDFWNLIPKTRYQKMLDHHAEECRKKYLQNTDLMQDAWASAQKTLRSLINTWLDGKAPMIHFEPLDKHLENQP